MGISHDPTAPVPAWWHHMRHAQICSHLESSDATRIGLVVSYDDIHVMTMNVIMICPWNVDIYSIYTCGYIYTFIYTYILIYNRVFPLPALQCSA